MMSQMNCQTFNLKFQTDYPRQVQKGKPDAESHDEGALNVLEQVSNANVAPSVENEAIECRPDMTNITCFKCGLA